MNGRVGTRNKKRDKNEENQDMNTRDTAATTRDHLTKPNEKGEQLHTSSKRGHMHDSYRITVKLLHVST